MEYAGGGVPNRPNPARPTEPPFRRGRQALIIGIFCLLATTFATDAWFVFFLIASPLVGLLGIAFTTVAFWRNSTAGLPDDARIASKSITMLVFAMSAYFVLAVLVLFQGMAIVSGLSKSTVTAANLRGLGVAIQMYCKDEDCFPADWDVLMAANNASSKQLFSPSDPNIFFSPTPPYYSSFVLFPASAQDLKHPSIVIAFEREPWSKSKLRFFSTPKRYVLFADGLVRMQDANEFLSALEADRKTRSQLNRPVYKWNEKSGLISPLSLPAKSLP